MEDFVHYNKKQYSKIECGDVVKYFINQELRYGGTVIVNKAPDYLVLKNFRRNVSWSLQLKQNNLKILVRSKKKMNEHKKTVYAFYKANH